MIPQNWDIRYMISATGATLCVQFLYPMDIIKTRMQSHDGMMTRNLVPKYTSIRNAIYQIYTKEGIKGFGRGIFLSFYANAISRSLFFNFYEKKKKQTSQVYGEKTAVFLASIYASWLASLITQPVWVTNTRIQLNMQKKTGFKNIVETVSQIYHQHGFKGFYRGLPMQLFISMHGMIQMNTYEMLQRISTHTFLAGMLSKGFAIFSTYPLTTIRTRIMQNQYIDSTEAKYKSALDILVKVIRHEGVKGFYKGITASFMKGMPAQGIYFYSYEYLKNILQVGRGKEKL